MRKAGEEEDWKKKTIDRGRWKRLSDEAVKSCVHHLTPFQKEKVEERASSVRSVAFTSSLNMNARVYHLRRSSCSILLRVPMRHWSHSLVFRIIVLDVDSIAPFALIIVWVKCAWSIVRVVILCNM